MEGTMRACDAPADSVFRRFVFVLHNAAFRGGSVRTAGNQTVHAGNPDAVLGLWVGALLPLCAWGAHLSLVALFAPLVCETSGSGWLYGAALVALLVDAAGGVVAWRTYRPTIGQPPRASADVIRRRYFGLVGTLASVIFAGAIVLQTLILSRHAGC